MANWTQSTACLRLARRALAEVARIYTHDTRIHAERERIVRIFSCPKLNDFNNNLEPTFHKV